MNSVESYMITNPHNKEDECARFVIDDLTDKFVLSEIAEPGQKYMLSFWVKSEAPGNLVFRFENYPTSTTWQKYTIPFIPTENYLLLKFSVAGTYYIYHSQLEVGDKATDWAPAPEDIVDSVNNFQIGARNLIRSSLDLMFGGYYFETSMNVTHDGSGNVVIESHGVTVTHDGNGNVTIEYANPNVTYDSDGNVTVR